MYAYDFFMLNIFLCLILLLEILGKNYLGKPEQVTLIVCTAFVYICHMSIWAMGEVWDNIVLGMGIATHAVP